MKKDKLNSKDLITIGIFASISIALFFIVGTAISFSILGILLCIPVTSFFMSAPYMVAAAKVKKRYTFFIIGTLNALLGLTTGNIIGVLLSIIGWFLAEYIASSKQYESKFSLMLTYTVGSTLYCMGYTLPIYMSTESFVRERAGMFNLTEEVVQQYLQMFTWPTFFLMAGLTLITAFTGSWLSSKIMKKHFVKAGLVE